MHIGKNMTVGKAKSNFSSTSAQCVYTLIVINLLVSLHVFYSMSMRTLKLIVHNKAAAS